MISTETVLRIMMDLPDDRQNPSDYDNCVYTNPYDGDNHCVVGEILTNLGYRLPDINSRLNEVGFNELIDDPMYTLSRDDFEPTAIDVLCWAQDLADRYTHDDKGNAWGLAKDETISRYVKFMTGGEFE